MTSYRTTVPNGMGGGTTYRDHIVNPTPDGVEAVRIADQRGGMVEISHNGVTGWEFYYAAPGSIFAEAAPAAAPAPVEVRATFQVCVDCMQWVAGIDEHERGEAYPAAVVEAMTAPEAATWHLVNTCGDDEETGHEYTCTSFTYAPCDTCASWLGGERHAVAALSR